MTKPNKFVLFTFVLLITSLYGCNPASAPIQSTITPESTLTLTPTATKIAIATLSPEPLTLEEMVKAFFAGEIGFPENLSDKEYSEFIKEMNRQRGVKPVYVEAVDRNGNPTVMYYNTETRKMEILIGTYQENKEIINQHTFNIYVEVGQDNSGLTTYTHPDTGEVRTVPNSGQIDWGWTGNKTNIDNGYIVPETINNITLDFAITHGYTVIQAILINNIPATIVFSQGMYFDYNCMDMIIIRSGKDKKVEYGIRVFFGPEGAINFVQEGSQEEVRLEGLKTRKQREKLFADMVYFIAFEADQVENWSRSRQQMDSLEHVYNAADVYTQVMNGNSKEGLIVVRVPLIILRDSR